MKPVLHAPNYGPEPGLMVSLTDVICALPLDLTEGKRERDNQMKFSEDLDKGSTGSSRSPLGNDM